MKGLFFFPFLLPQLNDIPSGKLSPRAATRGRPREPGDRNQTQLRTRPLGQKRSPKENTHTPTRAPTSTDMSQEDKHGAVLWLLNINDQWDFEIREADKMISDGGSVNQRARPSSGLIAQATAADKNRLFAFICRDKDWRVSQGLVEKGVSPGVAPQPLQQQARLTIGNSPRRYLPRPSQIPSHPRLPGLTSISPASTPPLPRPGPAEPASPRASEAFYYSPDNTLTSVPLTLVPLAALRPLLTALLIAPTFLHTPPVPFEDIEIF